MKELHTVIDALTLAQARVALVNITNHTRIKDNALVSGTIDRLIRDTIKDNPRAIKAYDGETGWYRLDQVVRAKGLLRRHDFKKILHIVVAHDTIGNPLTSSEIGTVCRLQGIELGTSEERIVALLLKLACFKHSFKKRITVPDEAIYKLGGVQVWKFGKSHYNKPIDVIYEELVEKVERMVRQEERP